MQRLPLLALLMTSTLLLPACQQGGPDRGADIARMQQTVQEQTEKIYFIHLKLDSASKAILEAEQKLQGGDCTDASYLVSEAYRNLKKANDDLLQMGQDLQAGVNLDAAGT